MAYIALYRKWRPASFADVVGQHMVMETLQKAILSDKVAHAYLFSGPRGTGKTSTARIFAKALNCPNAKDAEPCNACASCRHISAGESIDVTEVDAASNRSIEDIRNLRETVKFMPVEGRKKIFIIDEVHMLTMEAFNALLKTLEEPPAHVVFILATTEPAKIPMTILSRCQRFEFRRITSRDIAERLLYVAKESGFSLTEGAANLLAVQSDGGMRDALSLLDQCVGTMDSAIDEAAVRQLLGLVGRDWLLKLCGYIFANDAGGLMQALNEAFETGKEPVQLLMELLEHLRSLMLCRTLPEAEALAAYSDCMDELKAQAQSIEPPRLYAVIGILQEALNTARTSAMARVAAEAGLLTAASTLGQSSLDDLARRVQRLEEQTYAVPQALLDRISRLEAAAAAGTLGGLSHEAAPPSFGISPAPPVQPPAMSAGAGRIRISPPKIKAPVPAAASVAPPPAD